MINNYTKAKIFPPPVKKKYSRTHLMLLIMIYHLKAILSIKDIGVLFHVALAEPDAEKQAQQIETNLRRLCCIAEKHLCLSCQYGGK